MSSRVPSQVIELLRTQHHVISRAQLFGIGLTQNSLQRLLNEELWTRLDTGVYYGGVGEPPWLSLAWAASLAGGEDIALSGLSAAFLHSLTKEEPRPITLVTPYPNRARSRHFSRVTRSRIPRKFLTRKGLRVTGVADTLIDCAADVSPRTLESMVSRAFQRRLVSAKALKTAIANRRHVPKCAILTAAAQAASSGAHSILEIDYLRTVERRHGLPTGLRQASSTPGEYVDVHYRKWYVVVELDGREFHADSAFRDRRRDNRNQFGGASTLRYGIVDLAADPCAIAREVAAALTQHGWDGAFRQCRNCSPAQT